MMLPHTYLTKNGIKYIESLMRARTNVDNNMNAGMIEKHDIRTLNAIGKFPLFLNYRIYKSKQIKFYEKYYILEIAKNLFESLTTVLNGYENQQKYYEAASKIQPLLLNKIKKSKVIDNCQIMIENAKIQSTKTISQAKISGVFIHRDLNLPKECYSIEIKDENTVFYRIRNKLARNQHIEIMQQKKYLYNLNNYLYQQFYFDSYQNFILHENVKQILVQINTEIYGKFSFNNVETRLPLYMLSPITSHLMQIQIIQIPFRPLNQRAILTDIDYFMKGNPFIF